MDVPLSWQPSVDFLKYVIAALLIGSVAFLIILWVTIPEQTARAIGPAMLLGVALLGAYFLWRGKKQTTIQVLGYGAWLITTLICIMQGGVRTPMAYAYPLLILMTGWLISLRVAQLVAGLTVAVIVGLVLGESQRVLPAVPITPAALHGLVQVAVVIIAALLVTALVRAYHNRLKELHSIDRDLRALSGSLNEAQRIAKLGSWNLDLVSGQLDWSDETFRLFEVDQQRFGATYRAFLGAIHPDDRDKVDSAYKASLASQAPYEVTHRLRMSDGRIKWVQERCRSDFDGTGKALRSHGTVQDVTERKDADEQLRIAASAFESLQGMMITDANGVILRINRAFAEMTGYTADEIVGKTPRLLHSGRHDDAFYKLMWESIRSTGGWQGEVWDRRKNGEEYPVWLTISAVKDDSGVVTHFVEAQLDITERKRAEEEIAELAFSDQLTGLPNRRLLLDRLNQTMAASKRNGAHGALMMIDLDHFKVLNDTRGHDTGDLLLVQVAQRLRGCVRTEDTVARLGGDEFVVMLVNLSTSEIDAAAQTEAVGKKILLAFKPLYQIGGAGLHITPSIGATLFRGDLTSGDELMKQTDLAMYRSKDSGRNTLKFFDPTMASVMVNRAAMETNLRAAIDAQQFLLYFQAQVLNDGRVIGAESLVRWHQPQRGIVSPAEFIPLAEETGLILPLGQWILETACRQLARWAEQPGMAHLTLSVNVSALQFRQADFVDQVLTALRHSGVNPARLKLELTESLLISNVEDVIEKMFALKAKGVGFSLDDFGTGYSSLAYLKRLPIDQLKIDQSFVRDVLSDPNDAVLAKAIIALAQSLGLGVIAEGVETASQRDFLLSSGCHAFQGYFFSRPLPLGGFEAFVHANPAGAE